MKRKQFEHAVRAAGAVLGVDELLVIGSQALHATISGELPGGATRSAVAGRAKDAGVRGAWADAGMIDRPTLFERLAHIEDLDPRIREAVERRIRAI